MPKANNFENGARSQCESTGGSCGTVQPGLYVALKDMQLKPMFIEVHRLAQFDARGTEVSVILDLMIHDIDIILSIVKSDVKHISASGVAVLTDTPDIANVRIEFYNGCVANLTSSRISMKKMRKMRLFQKDAYIGIDFLDKKTEIIRLKEEEDTTSFSFDINTPAWCENHCSCQSFRASGQCHER